MPFKGATKMGAAATTAAAFQEDRAGRRQHEEGKGFKAGEAAMVGIPTN